MKMTSWSEWKTNHSLMFHVCTLAVTGLLLTMLCCCTPVFAETEVANGCVPTAILGDGNQVCDDGSGSSIWNILRTVMDIMSIGVGILGVIGVAVAGIQYLTAGGNEEKTRKAKRRMYEIVIGLIAYVVLLGFMSWIMPEYDVESAPANIGGLSGGSSITTAQGTFKKVGKKVYFLDKDGKKVTGEKKIDGATYYFNKNGEMQTGWVTIKKNGKVKRYYYYEKGSKKGKRAYGNSNGVLKAIGPENGIGKKDTWYLNKKTGQVIGVDMAVPRYQQYGYNCGPASLQFVRAYHIGKKSFGGGHPWDDQQAWESLCGGGSDGWDGGGYDCAGEFGYKASYKSFGGDSERGKEGVKSELLKGRPIILSAVYPTGNSDNGYVGGHSGHFLVIKGFYKNKVFFSDPAGRLTTSPMSTMLYVADSQIPASGWWFFRKKK